MNHALLIRGDAGRIPLPDRSVDLVFGSPPYVDARLYLEDGVDLGIARKCEAWVAWMLKITEEALRVSRGAVVWIAAGKTEGRNYQPACEGLMWEWWRRGGHAYRPCYWHRVGIPGSGGDQWFRADVEYAMAFKRPGPLPWTDNTAMGHPPKWAPGGEMSHRDAAGNRRNQWGMTPASTGARRAGGKRRSHGKTESMAAESTEPKVQAALDCMPPNRMFHQPNGTKEAQAYTPPVKANPGNLIRTKVGGGLMGSKLAHGNEAPFPEALAEWFLRSLCPPGGVVLDPFSGSATTAAAALKNNRNAIGLDLRQSQCDLGRRRVAEASKCVENPGLKAPKPRKPLNGQRELFAS